MNQINLGQASVREVVTELKSSLDEQQQPRKRGYYQATNCNKPHYEQQVKLPKLGELNFDYFEDQYGEVLEVQKNREVRRKMKQKFWELHEHGRKMGNPNISPKGDLH